MSHESCDMILKRSPMKNLPSSRNQWRLLRFALIHISSLGARLEHICSIERIIEAVIQISKSFISRIVSIVK